MNCYHFENFYLGAGRSGSDNKSKTGFKIWFPQMVDAENIRKDPLMQDVYSKYKLGIESCDWKDPASQTALANGLVDVLTKAYDTIHARILDRLDD